MTRPVRSIALSLVALVLLLSAPAEAQTLTYKGEALLPAVFAFRCDSQTSDPLVRDCPQGDPIQDPYGGGAGKLIQWTHSWVQIHDTSGVGYNAQNGDELRLYLFGKDGKSIQVNQTYCPFPVFTDPYTNKTYIDVLGGPAGGKIDPNGTVFFFINQCLNDGHPSVAPDAKPPTSGVLSFKKNLVVQPGSVAPKTLAATFHAGWEEGESNFVYNRWYYTVKAGSLVDKERVELKP